MSKFVYQRRSKEDIKKRATSKGGGFDSYIKPEYKMYKIRDGKNLIRILPPTFKGATHYGYDIYVNFGIGVDNQAYLSLSKMKGERDPIAEARKQAEREGNEELVKSLNPTYRVLMWVIDRQAEEEGPQLWAAPFSVDKSIANLCFDEDTKEILYIDEPETGNDLRFYREGEGLKTRYDASKMKLLGSTPLHEDDDIKGEWLDYVTDNPLPDTLNFYSYDHISAVFNGSAPEDSSPKSVDDDEPPFARGEISAKGKQSSDEDEDTAARLSKRYKRRQHSEDDED